MRTLKKIKLVLGSVLMIALTPQISFAQTYHLNNGTSTLKIDGTSNIHDWDITAEDQQGNLVVNFANGELIKIEKLDFSVTAESLKSGKSSMDKNTYKALNTGKHKKIIYKLNKVNSIDCPTNTNCKVSSTGSLTIAGTTKPVNINFEIKVIDSKIVISGSKSLKMSEFGIDPPTAVFGTITTGDAVDIKFQSTFIK